MSLATLQATGNYLRVLPLLDQYYLTNSIYPDRGVCVKSVQRSKNKREKTFGKQQEALRKAIERFFGVLFRKYRILRNLRSLLFMEDMAYIVENCVIMHNMTVKMRKSGYTGTRKARISVDTAEAESVGPTTADGALPSGDLAA